MVLMGDCKDALKYLELLEIATLRRFTDVNLFADKINLVFYLCIWKICEVRVSLALLKWKELEPQPQCHIRPKFQCPPTKQIIFLSI